MKFLALPLLTICVVIWSVEGLSPTRRPPPPPPTPKPPPRNKFSVVAPNTIRSGKTFTVYVRALDVTGPIDVKIVLASDNEVFKIENNVRLDRSLTKKTFRIDTTDIPTDGSGFTLTVTSGDYTESKSVAFIGKRSSIFIQTNKAIFKPSEIVQFRLFSIDSESNAINPTGPVVISLRDPRDNEIGSFTNVSFTNGKFENQFLLPSKPIFGRWRLSVQNGDENDLKTLVVEEYTLSLFTASLSVGQQVSYAARTFPVTINAEYTFKQPISGIASVTISTNSGSITRNISCTDKSTTFYVDIVKDLGYTTSSFYYVSISLVFIDPKTNTKATDRASISIVPYTYTLEIINVRLYRPGDYLDYTIVSKNLEGKPAPRVRGTIVVGNQRRNFTTSSTGIYEGYYRTNASNPSYLSLQASGQNCQNGRSYANPLGVRPSEGISLSLVTENPSFKNPVTVIATVAEEVEFFYYFVTSKGVLLESRKVYFDEDYDPDYNPYTVEFTINPTFAYAPSLKIYAYYYRKSDFKFFNTNLQFDFKPELPNYLNLKLRKSTIEPGKNLSLTIESNAHSTISLSAVDQRVLQLARNQNFTLSEVIDSFSEYGNRFGGGIRRRPIYNYDFYNAQGSGLNFFSNIPLPTRNQPVSMERPSRPSAPRAERPERPSRPSESTAIKVRKDFREVFLFEDVYMDDDSLTISRKVTDQITTYLIYGVSMSKYDGMGLPEVLPEATIFLPFFISLELPASVKRGELLTLDIQVFNFLTTAQTADITVASDPKFTIVNADSLGWINSTAQILQKVKIASGKVATIKLQIRPKTIGTINIKVTAKTPTAGDAVEKPLRVIPEGVARSITTSTLIAIDGDTIPEDRTLACNLPASAYSDTTDISATVIGDILGKALNNLDKLIMMPGGCGEQNMIGFVPDYAILKYLQATNQLTATLNAQLIQYLTLGYQNQLQYQRFDGSFSAFGNSDPSGSTWLTSYVILYFQKASPYITVNPTVIQSGLSFIIEQQNADGSFNEPGRVIHSDMQGGAANGIALTAYVSIALSALTTAYPDAVAPRNLAITYLEGQLSSITDTYALAVIAYALQIANSPSKTAAFNSFFALRAETSTEIKWSVPAPASASSWYGARSLDIEVTGYGLSLLAARNAGLSTTLKVVKYLTSQSNSFGGYSSSQDTVVGLIALSDFAIQYTLNQANVDLDLTPNVGTAIDVSVSGTNTLTLQKFALKPAARSLNVHVNAGSTGVAVVSLICNFYEDPTKVVPTFNVTYDFSGSCQWRIQMKVCVAPVSGSSSNMAIMELNMPSGYYYYQAWWLNNENNGISKTETYEGNTVVVFYFDSISSKGSCVTFAAGKSADVADVKPGSITINDYYDTSKQGSSSFSIPSGVTNKNCGIIYF